MTVSEAARRIGAKPLDVSLLFYHRHVDDSAAPIVKHRRDIPEHLLPTLADKLRERGKLDAKGLTNRHPGGG
jgi:hypothetical protein